MCGVQLKFILANFILFQKQRKHIQKAKTVDVIKVKVETRFESLLHLFYIG